MKLFLNFIILLIIGLVLLSSSCKEPYEDVFEVPGDNSKEYVVMLSLDGFKYNYSKDNTLEAFDEIKSRGVSSRLQPSFPTKTFPNHYSIATGLYPDNHGIVNNTFWDPTREVIYKISDRSKVTDGYFYGGEPIWVTAEKQGVKSASYFWVGSEAEIDGIQPSIWKVYDHDFPYYQRADSVIAWLKLPESKRPHLITWYVDQPDSYGHKYGPNSNEIKDKLQELDQLLAYFIAEAKKLDIYKDINFIITADHGMGEISDTKYVNLKDYIKSEWGVHLNGGNPVYNVWAEGSFKDSVANVLANVANINIYDKNNIPERLHYMNNDRCGDFVIVADSGWTLWNSSSAPSFGTAGTHGYDNNFTEMDAIFYAYGPSFKSAYIHPKFKNVEIYNLICNILDLKPVANDGDFNNVKDMLEE